MYNAITWSKAGRRGTLYQQKWNAKAETRAYHGEKLTETQFRNLFDGTLHAVAPLQSSNTATKQPTPFALQTYAAVERRLDQAVFRAMFASSPRQAAQFIRYGKVKVNGIPIKHSGYELKPGDMFSVDPDRVLQALGRGKPSLKESVDVTNSMIRRYNKYLKKCKRYPEYMWKARQRFRKRHPLFFQRYEAAKEQRIEAAKKSIYDEMNKDINALTPSEILKSILLQEPTFDKLGTLPNTFGPTILNKSLSVFQLVTGKKPDTQKVIEAEKQGVEEENVEAQTQSEPVTEQNKATNKSEEIESKPIEESEPESKSESSSSEAAVPQADSIHVEATVKKYFPPAKADGTKVPASELPPKTRDIKQLLNEIIKARSEQIEKAAKSKLKDAESQDEVYDPSWISRLGSEIPLIEDAEAIAEDPSSVLPIRLPWQSGGHFGLQNPDKPYFTPWAPRPFLSPFVIYPHHIEISFETCHAVYLKDPVARPGHSEVISPFPLDMHERAYMFYATRRRK